MTTTVTRPIPARRGDGHEARQDSPRRPRWVRPALWLLLAGTAALYLVNLGASGYANSFYAAAVQAGAQSWKALLFGSLDSGGAITVDKPPAALWVMGLSARIFGFSSWSMLVPQALEGVASVALLYGAVRRLASPAAGLLAGAALALTPVAVLMFRFNNPDALLVLLLVAGAYCVVRATERASLGWLALAGVAIGFGFDTKMLQAFLVLPAFAAVYLIAAPTGLRRRIGHVLGAGLAVIVSAGWYVALVELWPASARPYIGGSTDNSLLELAFGYNGLGRIFGGQGNGGQGNGGGGGFAGGGNTMFGGSSGIGRLFGSSMGTEISWLLPAALIGLLAGLWFSRRTPRTGHTRAALVLWGGWLLVTGLVFSYMQGTIHPYYTVALAPAIAALIGISGWELWRAREHLGARLTGAVMVAASGVWAFVLLERTPDWLPALRWIVLVLAVLVALAVAVGVRRLRALAIALLAAVVLTGLAGTGAYAVDTAAQPHTGSIPTSGPSVAGRGGFGGSAGPGHFGRRGGEGRGTGAPGGGWPGGGAPNGGWQGAPPNGGGAGNGQGGVPNGGGIPTGGGQGGGPGGDQRTSAALVSLLKSTNTRWAAATLSSMSAAPMELGSGKAVMAIGGFTGSDNSPTLAQFQTYVRQGAIAYFVGSGGMGHGPGGDSGSGTQISNWVKEHFTAKTVGGRTVYDLRAAATK